MLERRLLTITALIEVATGLAILAAPSSVSQILLGAALETPASLVVARVAGLALLALGLACWVARRDHASRAAYGLIVSMLIYNAGVSTLLTYVSLGEGLSGPGTWPVIVGHVAMACWCLACIAKGRFNVANGPQQ